MDRENMSFTTDLGPEVDNAVQKVLDAVAGAVETLEPVEHVVALVVLQLYIEAQKSVMDEPALAAYEGILKASSATTFPIIEATDGEE